MRGEANLDRAFTLVELLTVMAIIIIMMVLLVPAINGIKKGSDLTKAAYDISGILEQARTYAIANNTYVWVGLFEEDISKNDARPAVSGIGRIAICMVASKDGTSIYNKAQTSSTPNQVLDPSRLVRIGKLKKLDNVHILDASQQKIGARLANVVKQEDLVGLASQPLLFSFQYPLGGAATYTFGIRPAPVQNGAMAPSGIVQFSPQGEASSESKGNSGIASCKEIAIQASNGTQIPPSQNIVAIDINGLTGITTIYRP
jgi:Tfp pilus assembly protein FimT